MSSFKRKISAKQATVSYPGTRVSPASSSTINTSTGITSLDDILGGGLPLSCSLVVAAPDLHSSYGQLVQKYFIAEGLACGHRVCVIDSNPAEFVKDVMWFPKSVAQKKEDMKEGAEDAEEQADRKVKIAWRYEQMKQFQTTVSSPTSSSDNYCHVFDLTSRFPTSVLGEALDSGRLSLFTPEVTIEAVESIPTLITLRNIEKLLQDDTSVPLRVCIPSLGSPACWGDLRSQMVLYFLHSLRALLRKYPHGCASVTLSPHVSAEPWGGLGWLQKIGWVSDACLNMSAFSADPSLSTIFSSHHGFVHILSLPSPNTLVPPSDRFSTLRGLASSSSSFGGSGENNLAFKCTRKRLMFETLHLDLEGGVSERRTTAPSSTAVELTTTTMIQETISTGHKHHDTGTGPKIDIQLEELQLQKEEQVKQTQNPPSTPESKPKKPKKKVAFFSDRPDLYDF